MDGWLDMASRIIILICNMYEISVYFLYWNRDENIFSNVNIIPWKMEVGRNYYPNYLHMTYIYIYIDMITSGDIKI